MKFISWNVNGIRAVAKKGFMDWFINEDADIVCLQETKAFKSQLPSELQCPEGYHSVWHSGTKAGYAGTVIYSKEKPISEKTIFEDAPLFNKDGNNDSEETLFESDKDNAGRVIETKFKNFTLLNIYFPNGAPRSNGSERLSFKLKFYEDFLNYIENLRKKGESVIICGDFNICHTEIDIARPKENEKSIGFLPVERAWISKIIEHGYIDTLRYLHPDKKDYYTWWSYRAGARPRNVGWRLDYFFVSPDLKDKIKNIEHQTDVMGSDHCPVKLEIF